MATRFSILAWKIPWTEEPGGLQSMGPQRVGPNLETKSMCACTHTHTHMFIGRCIEINPALLSLQRKIILNLSTRWCYHKTSSKK